MLRADNVVCGTTNNGTGALTLAACPTTVGGLDFYNWLTATGLNFVNGNAILVSYTIIEYTAVPGGAAIRTEKGIGTLTLGSSLVTSNLARTTVQSTQTGMNTSTPVLNVSAPTAISIVSAANTLIFIGGSAADTFGFVSYVDTANNSDGPNVGFGPLRVGVDNVSSVALNNNFDYFVPFIWPRTMLVKRATIYVSGAYTGQNSNLYGRLYQVGSTAGRPGKLLYDFGNFGTLNSGLASTGLVSTGASGSGFLLTPGEYWFDLAVIWTVAGTGTPAIFHANSGGYVQSGALGTNLLRTNNQALGTAAVAVAPDPAGLTGYTPTGAANPHPVFLLSAT